MKTILRSFLPALGLFTITAMPVRALTPFIEEFNEVALSPTRWSLTEEGGLLAPSAGALHYSVSTVGSASLSYILLRDVQPKNNESWEVTVDAVNAARSNDNWTSIGVAVFNTADLDDFVHLEIASGDENEIYSDFGTNGVESEVKKTIRSTSVSLRVTFSSVTKVITLWYRTSPTVGWKKHATFSTINSTNAQLRGNWRMKKAGKFSLALYGSSDGEAVLPGQMSLDNFAVRRRK